MSRSPFSKIADAVAVVTRKIQDITIDILGQDVFYVRVNRGVPDDFGYSTDSYQSGIVNNCIINYPLQEVEIFDATQNNNADVDSIYLEEILPITLLTKFYGSGIVGIEEGDILVDVLKDEQGSKIPIRLEVKKQTGAFQERYIYGRTYELSLVRGEISEGVETAIDAYIESVQV